MHPDSDPLRRQFEELREENARLRLLVSQPGGADPRAAPALIPRAESGILRTLIERSPDLIFVKDTAGRYILVNQAMALMVGAGGPEELIGKTDFDFHPAELAARYQADEQEILRTGQPLVDREEPVLDAAGKQHWLSTTKVPLPDAHGRMVGLVGIGRDITARTEAQEVRREWEKRLLHAQKLESLGVLAGGIAHDFNNILMGILGNADLALLRLEEDATVRPYLQRVVTEAQRAAALAAQMLAYSGKCCFSPEPVDLSRLVAEMSPLLRTVVSQKARLRLEAAPGPPPIIAGDPALIRQVVATLVTNASEALQDQEGRITLTTGVMEASRAYLYEVYLDEGLREGRYAYLEVADTGVGMDAATQARIFDPFFTTKFVGRGLSLAAALGTVRAHRGAIRVESAPGQGATFRVLFPWALGPAGAREEEPLG